eukprot:scaffold107331_cov48-Phaeocystis_antarctica.AAC.1
MVLYPRKGGRVWVQHRQQLYMQNTCNVHEYNVHWHVGGYGDSGPKGTAPYPTGQISETRCLCKGMRSGVRCFPPGQCCVSFYQSVCLSVCLGLSRRRSRAAA